MVIAPLAARNNNPLSVDDFTLTMLLVVPEVTLVDLVLGHCVEPTEATLHTGDPITCVVIATVPYVLTLAMPLIHIELALVVSIWENQASFTMLVAF